MRIVGIECNVDSARVLVLVQNLFPVLASIGGAKDSAFGIRPKRVAQRGYEDNIRILRIDDHFPDRPRIMQPDIFPGLPAIDCFVNSIAMRDVAANAGLARSHVNDVWIRRRDRQASNCGDGLLIEN